DYEIGWICALHVEFAAAQALLDLVHETLPLHPNDSNHYVLGQMGRFNVALACLPAGGMGMNNAAIVSSNMRRTFVSIELQLVVGIAGGVPSATNDIRLGDVVVGLNVVQHDFGKTIQEGLFTGTATVYTPSAKVMAAVTALRAQYDMRGSQIPSMLDHMLLDYPKMTQYASRDRLQDDLFESTYEHPGTSTTCETCARSRLVTRGSRAETAPIVHFGTIASGNQVIKHGQTRDRIGLQHDALCLEMEGAALKGLDTPFLVIRGVCDYANSHKNKQWQPYSAAVAAACAKEIISLMQPSKTIGDQGTKSRAVADGEPSTANAAQAAADDKKRFTRSQTIINSLHFDQIDARYMNIKSAHTRTCSWLLNTQEYQDWLDPDKLEDHHGLIWIKGKPGAGKSTIMKFLLGEVQKNKSEDQTIISFFFNARGSHIEKSVQGLYQSLLHQLFTRISRLHHVLDTLPAGPDGSVISPWTTISLQEILKQCVPILGGHSLFCLVDALDEGDQDEIRAMVYFFEELGNLARGSDLSFHLCFASRHYPHITVRNGVELVLEHHTGHERDIANYIADKLNVERTNATRALHTKIQEKAMGVFMWVVLVVAMLNKHFDHGFSFTSLQRELDQIPRDLHALFRDLLQRDGDNTDHLLSCIQWILFSARPLKPNEMYLAINLGNQDPRDISIDWEPERMTPMHIKTFILSCSKGLAEIANTGEGEGVQFIHESVRDFLLKENGLYEVWPGLRLQLVGLSHEKLKSCCFDYLSNHCHAMPLGWESPTKLRERFFFTRYAVEHVLYHANEAQHAAVEQRSFMHQFSTWRSQWVELSNSLKMRGYKPNVSVLYLLAERDLDSLIRVDPRILECLTSEPERFQTPFIAALATGSWKAAKSFLAAIESAGNSPSRHADIYAAKMLRGGPFVPEDKFVWKRSVLSYIAEYGNDHIFCAILRSGILDIDIPRDDMDGRTLLSWASGSGLQEGVLLLLERQGPVELADYTGRTPLIWAAANGHGGVVSRLIKHGARIDAADARGRTSLSLAAEKGHDFVIRELLRRGADTEAVDKTGEDDCGRTPLSLAAQHGNVGFLRLLIERGAKVDLQDDQGRTPLSYAIEWHHKQAVFLLLEH
ncbi:hypothetical protein Micbo1qcDRAFT_98608, partial [Microdochium bolleyi]